MMPWFFSQFLSMKSMFKKFGSFLDHSKCLNVFKLYADVCTDLLILLIVPVTKAKAMRNISKLKLVKTICEAQ